MRQTATSPVTETDAQKAARKADEIADAIVAVAAGARALLASRLHTSAIVLLIHDAIPQSKRPSRAQIRTVLETAGDLAVKHTKKR